MNYTLQNISAAISELADRSMIEQNVEISDTDTMAVIMAEAEKMVASHLARLGMELTEAEEQASKASMMPGKQTDESKRLAEEAYFHRHASVVNSASNPQETRSTNENTLSDEEEYIVSNDEPSSSQSEIQNQKESVTPAKARTGRNRPMTNFTAEPLPLKYEIKEKKVHEIFKGIDASDKIFDFKVPFIVWEKTHPKVPTIDPSYSFDVGQLHTFLYAISEKASLNIVGPHGCGKTQAVKQIAARLNYPVTTLPMDGQLSRRELIGQEKIRATEYGNESYFSEGLLPKALKEPGIILFDEVDRGVSDLQYACHSVYLQDGLTILEDAGRFVPFHDYNRVFGTSNTKGRGSMDGMYQATEEMSEATRDRWSLWVEMDYPTPEEDYQVVINKTPGIEPEYAKIITEIVGEIRTASKTGHLSQTCSMRQQLEVAKKFVFLCKNETDPERKQKALRHAFERVVGGRASPEDQGAIEVFLQVKIPQAYTGDPLF